MSRLGLLRVNTSSSYKDSLIKLFATPHSYSISKLNQKYSTHKGERDEEIVSSEIKERAPSTAEIMEQLSREKEEKETSLDEKTRQGYVSQTSDSDSEKMVDATKEAIGGGGVDRQAVKEKYKDKTPGQTYHKPQKSK